MIVTQTMSKKPLLACIIGNIIEWYEFIVFGYFASILGQVFFEPSSPLMSMFKVFGIFALGVFVRPLGGLFLGHIGDKFGRKNALVVSLLLMSVPTFLIGCLPTYQSIGIFASIALFLVRILQGLAMGGEYAGAMVYLVEKSQPSKRGWYGSIAALSLVTGMALGAFVSGLLQALLTQDQIYSWGWRIPFFLSFMGLLWGFYLRTTLDETIFFNSLQEDKAVSKFPLKDLFLNFREQLALTVFSQYFLAVGMYTMTVFYANYALNTFKNLNTLSQFLINTPGVIFIGLSALLSGRLSDVYGPKKTLLFASLIAIAVNYFTIPLVNTGTLNTFLGAHLLMSIATGIFLGPIPAFLAKSFPVNTRYTSVALSNNLSMGIFGGTAPMVITYLMTVFPDQPVANYYLMIGAVISLISLLCIKDVNLFTQQGKSHG